MNRREFLKDSAVAASVLGLGAAAEAGAQQNTPKPPAANPKKPEAGAQEDKAKVDQDKLKKLYEDKPEGPAVKVGVIGMGERGREIVTTLGRMGNTFANVVLMAETYAAPGYVKRLKDAAPGAEVTTDYRKILDNKDVQAVFIATPTHMHRQIALDAIQAGKHVYCETPLAHTVEDSRAIAEAALAGSQIFQTGLYGRTNGQYTHVHKFVESNMLGKRSGGRAQFHKKAAWRRLGPSEQRQNELDWKLKKASSNGLLGEEGIYLLDTASWFFNALPVAVSGIGAKIAYPNGEQNMEHFNTVTAVAEYPGNLLYNLDLTLTNSYDDVYCQFLGDQSAIVLRDQFAWLFKETDADLIGWEVFARKDEYSYGDTKTGVGLRVGTGIALIADATKQIALFGKTVGQDTSKTSLYQGIRSFFTSIWKNQKPAAHAAIGHDATVVGIKANEAVMQGQRIAMDKAWFEVKGRPTVKKA